MANKKETIFRDRYGLRPGWMIAFMSIGITVGVVLIATPFVWMDKNDCEALCEIDQAKPAWTFSNGCACLKDGELKKPLAYPIDLDLSN